MIALIKDKCNTLNDFKDNLEFFFVDTIEYEDQDIDQLRSSLGMSILNCFLLAIDKIKSNDSFVLNDIVQLIQSDINCSPKEIWQVLRLSLTGQRHGPSLESIILIYGFQKTAKRIHAITES